MKEKIDIKEGMVLIGVNNLLYVISRMRKVKLIEKESRIRVYIELLIPHGFSPPLMIYLDQFPFNNFKEFI